MTAIKKQVNDTTTALAATGEAAPTPPPIIALGILQGTSPAALMAAASEVAGELARMIEAQRLWDPINGKKYVKVEGWTTLAMMMGVVAREVDTTEDNGIYTAVVELVRMSDGASISRASAECGDEKPWSTRARYARRSMAQTRATGKACRLAFSWVMSLAGYEPTPFEEMPSEPVMSVVPQTARASDQPINSKQHQMLETRITESGLSRDRVKVWVKRSWQVEHLNELSNDQLTRLLVKIQQWAADESNKVNKAEAGHEAV